jgi:hypothetical protein
MAPSTQARRLTADVRLVPLGERLGVSRVHHRQFIGWREASASIDRASFSLEAGFVIAGEMSTQKWEAT